jgi:hypothetical protein
MHRAWYGSCSQWITDFNSLTSSPSSTNQHDGMIDKSNMSSKLLGLGGQNGSAGLSSHGSIGRSLGQGAGDKPYNATGLNPSSSSLTSSINTNTNEVFIVPADENFTRCPISKEAFESFWDDEEGELMYRNAVKVLVTESADPALYKLGKETNQLNVRYIIVHKLLVLDSWLMNGRADTLSRVKLRYSVCNSTASEIVNASISILNSLVAAAGDDEDEDDIFAIIDLSHMK